MNKYRIAAILLIIHGGLFEIAGALVMIPVLLWGNDQYDVSQYFSFKLQYFQDNLELMVFMGAIYGLLRIIAAVGLLKNRMWGLALAIILCWITLTLMMFMLPAGIVDGLLSSVALILVLFQYFGKADNINRKGC